MIVKGARHALAGHRPVVRVEVFRIHERAIPPESRRARQAYAAAAAGCRNQALASKLEKVGEAAGRVREGVSRVTLTSDSPFAHPARDVAGVKAAWGWMSGKMRSMRSFLPPRPGNSPFLFRSFSNPTFASVPQRRV